MHQLQKLVFCSFLNIVFSYSLWPEFSPCSTAEKAISLSLKKGTRHFRFSQKFYCMQRWGKDKGKINMDVDLERNLTVLQKSYSQNSVFLISGCWPYDNSCFFPFLLSILFIYFFLLLFFLSSSVSFLHKCVLSCTFVTHVLHTLGLMAQSTHNSTKAPKCYKSTKEWTFLSEATLRNNMRKVWKKEEFTEQIVGKVNSLQQR